jgi:hypothetical protein
MMAYPPLDPSFPRGRFRGRVYDPFTNFPLAAAAVWVDPLASAEGLHYPTSLGSTDQDGHFDFASIPIGDYYTYAYLAGYVSAISGFPGYNYIGGTMRIIAIAVRDAVLQKVSIRENETASVDIKLEIGGSISGRVCWQSGAPARHHPLQAMIADAEKERYVVNETKTDADGNYCMANLYTGRFIIGAKTNSPILYDRKSGYSTILGPATIKCFSELVWNDGSLWYNDASPIAVKTRTAITGIDLVIPQQP